MSVLRSCNPRSVRGWMLLMLVPLSSAAAQDLLDLNFEGHYRDKPKTSIVRTIATDEPSPPTHYANLSDLLNSLPSEASMRQSYPDLNKKQSGFPETREPEELRNVDVDCWIYAVKFEDGRGSKKGDNDIHVIVGSAAGSEFMTAEISGLPASGKNRFPLEDTRKKFLKLLDGYSFTSSFKKISPPLKVTIRGSLFFDGDHQSGCTACPGPKWAKPRTVWEIHPVYSIISGG